MTIRKLIFLISVAVLLSNTLNAQKFTSDYTALTVPHHYFGDIYYVKNDKTIVKKYVDSLKHDKSILDSFSNIVSNVTVYEMDEHGKLTILGVGISRKRKNYQVIYDFSQTQTVHIGNKYENFIVGISVRMVAKFKSLKSDINLTSPFNLVGGKKKVEGTLEIKVSGIGSKKINTLIPTPSDLSPTSIASALQAIATIKSHIYDKETIIIPQVLAYSEIDKDLEEKINPTIKNEK